MLCLFFYFLQEIYCSVCYNKRFSNSLKPDHEQNGNGEIIPIVVDVQPDDCIRCKKKVRIIKIILNKTFAISVFNPQRFFFLSNLQIGRVFVFRYMMQKEWCLILDIIIEHATIAMIVT